MNDVLMQRLAQYSLDSRDATPVEVPVGLIERMAEKVRTTSNTLLGSALTKARSRNWNPASQPIAGSKQSYATM